MTTTRYTRFVAVSFATMLLLGAVAPPAAAGLPSPPARPNDHDVDVADGFYDGGVLVVKTKDTKVTETETWTVDCDGNLHELSVTHRNEYGLSLSGPLGDAEQNGVEQAVGDLRPEKQGSVTDEEDYKLPRGNKKVTIQNTATYQHTHYRIYLGGSSQIELIGYLHIKTLEGSAWDPEPRRQKLKKACGGGGGGGGGRQVAPPRGRHPPVPFGGRPPIDNNSFPRPFLGPPGRPPVAPPGGPPPADGKYPFQSPQLPVGPGGDGPGPTGRPPVGEDSAHADGGSDLTGQGTADEATVLLSGRFRNTEVPGVAQRFVAAKRLNVELEGGTVGMRTDDDGNPVSVRTVPYEDPDATVTVDDATLRELESASDPVTTARRKVARGRIEYSTSDPVDQAAFYAADAGLRCVSFARGVASTVGSFARGVTAAL